MKYKSFLGYYSYIKLLIIVQFTLIAGYYFVIKLWKFLYTLYILIIKIPVEIFVIFTQKFQFPKHL